MPLTAALLKLLPAAISLAVLIAFLLCAPLRAKDPVGAGVMIAPMPMSRVRLKHVLRDIENWNGHSVGRHGELGPFQFKASTWQKYSHRPHAWAESRTLEQADEVYRVFDLYLDDLIRQCHALRLEISPYNLALLHNSGWRAVSIGQIQADGRDFAQRVQNLYDDESE